MYTVRTDVWGMTFTTDDYNEAETQADIFFAQGHDVDIIDVDCETLYSITHD